MATVLLTGGTGMIGTAITKALQQKGHRVVVLTRKVQPSAGGVVYRKWNPATGAIDPEALAGVDYIIHLAGANVADQRWTKSRKQEIVDSRVQSGALLVKALQGANSVKAVVSASAIGWYGADPQVPNPRPFVEEDAADQAFLGKTCQQWERAISPVKEMGKRLVLYRIGIVLSNEGGAYAEFKKPLQFGVASVLGNGRQIISWIHIDDLVQLFLKALDDEGLQGVYNAVAPHPVSNKELISEMAAQKNKFSVTLPVPAFGLKLMLGEMSVEILKSATVSSKKIERTGYQFLYPRIADAIAELEGKK